MWNTDPILVVICLSALALFLAGFCVIQALMLKRLLADAAQYVATVRELRQRLQSFTKRQDLQDICVNPANYPARR